MSHVLIATYLWFLRRKHIIIEEVLQRVNKITENYESTVSRIYIPRKKRLKNKAAIEGKARGKPIITYVNIGPDDESITPSC